MWVDDQMHGHRKFARLRDDRMAATGVWITAGSWCAAALTDGFVPDYIVAQWDPSLSLAGRLVDVGLWKVARHDGDPGFRFHDWTSINRAAEEIEADRESNRQRQAAYRERRRARNGQVRRHGPASGGDHEGVTETITEDPPSDGVSNGECNALRNGEYNGESRVSNTTPSLPFPTPPFPTQPFPTERPKSSPSRMTTPSEGGPPRADVEAVCERLRERITDNGYKPDPKITGAWRRDARLMLDVDGRELAQVLRLIDWAATDPFWSPNIRSPGKLRKQYDLLIGRAREEHARNAAPGRHLSLANGGPQRVPTTTARVAAAQALKRPEWD